MDCPLLILLSIERTLLLSFAPVTTTLGCPGARKRNDFVTNGRSKSKSSNTAETVPRSKLDLGKVNDPDFPLKNPDGFGISLILKVETEETFFPSGKVPET